MARKFYLAAVAAFALTALAVAPASAQAINPNLNPTVKVGKSVTIKGVRGSTCGQAPSSISPMPTSSLGIFSQGRVGTMNSRKCNGATPALALVFTGKTPGTETLSIFDDTVTITVVK